MTQHLRASAAAACALGASVAFAMAGAGTAGSDDGAGYIVYSGVATAPNSGKFLYGEHDVLMLRGDRPAERVVLYTCRDGSAFARKTVSYGDPMAPDFSLQDGSNGMREGVLTAGAAREAFFRGAHATEDKRSTLPNVPGLVVDAGFDEFVKANWNALMAGKSLTMPFWVPSRLQSVEFRVKHVNSDQAGNTQAEVFRLKLAGVLGVVVPGIDVYYGAADHVLLRYVGLSDLRDGSNDNFRADIVFQRKDRRNGGPGDLASARNVRLAACR